jgi:SpoVK/Ycf46/Vps4 family AAA+-type ATPase
MSDKEKEKRKREDENDSSNKRPTNNGTAPKIVITKVANSSKQNDDQWTQFLGPYFYDHTDTETEEEDYEEEEEEEEEEIEDIIVPDHLKTLETLDQLIELGSLYDPKKRWNGCLQLKKLHALIPSLQSLKQMIGMKQLKSAIVDFIVFYLQDLDNGQQKDFMHTVLEGPPGCGKTEIGKILCSIYVHMGLIKRNYFRVVKRHELIGQYLGQTAPKTQKVIDDCLGGVMFIDEAYSLGNPEGRDIYSKECLDTLNQNLTEHKDSFICIIAGYKDALKHSFFAVNEGLESRFPIRFEVDPYNGEELFSIFKKIVKERHWSFEEEERLKKEFFVKHEKDFPYYGRDMEVLFQKTKIAHSKRIYSAPKEKKKKISQQDIEQGFLLYQKMNKERKKETPPPFGLYN